MCRFFEDMAIHGNSPSVGPSVTKLAITLPFLNISSSNLNFVVHVTICLLCSQNMLAKITFVSFSDKVYEDNTFD